MHADLQRAFAESRRRRQGGAPPRGEEEFAGEKPGKERAKVKEVFPP